MAYLENVTFGQFTRMATGTIAVGSAIVCVHGINMTKEATATADEIGGVFLTLISGGICLTATIGYVFSAAALR